MTVLVLCNGEVPERSRLIKDREAAGLFICADGGANTAYNFGMKPDLIIGDFDSVLPEVLLAFSDVRQVRIDDQETTDFEKVLLFCRKECPEKIIIWGALGLRIDHTFGNLSSLIRLGTGLDITLKSNLHTAWRLPGGWSGNFSPGTTLSLLPVPVAGGITTSGLEWELENDSLEFGKRNGTLNRVTTGPVSIRHESGNLILMELLA
ncbi:MAG: thiamine diphosphokinase [Bacteroidetes bacterium]|nr:thiamine diphosphokinase [Bacteroidota bacterium]